MRAALELEAAGRAANVVRLIEEAPVNLRPAILRAANSPLVQFSLDKTASVDKPRHAGSGIVVTRIRALLGDTKERVIRVDLHQIARDPPPMRGISPEMDRMHRTMIVGQLESVEMQLSIALEEGNWLNVATRFHRPPLQWAWAPVVTFGLTVVMVIVVVWLTLSRLTGPLRKLAGAVERLGRGEAVAELPETGPDELRRLTSAFNEMQARLSRFISERTTLLAALGHDLRSPLTAIRVRAEMVEDDENRERLTAIIEEMQDMVEATLSFAQGMVTSESSLSIELSGFLSDLCRDITETGGTVELKSAPELTVRLRPNAMRRALRNVIENAIRYGGRVEVCLERAGDLARVTVSDSGPGIPEEDLERVFDPFVRVEKSRSTETGGTGLGLSIARTIVHAQGGEIRLSNRAGGGLTAIITLPLEVHEARNDTESKNGPDNRQITGGSEIVFSPNSE